MWLNLHDYLYRIAGGGPYERGGFEAEVAACFESLPEGEAAGWRAADTFYRERRRDPRRE